MSRCAQGTLRCKTHQCMDLHLHLLFINRNDKRGKKKKGEEIRKMYNLTNYYSRFDGCLPQLYRILTCSTNIICVHHLIHHLQFARANFHLHFESVYKRKQIYTHTFMKVSLMR